MITKATKRELKRFIKRFDNGTANDLPVTQCGILDGRKVKK